VPFSENLSNLLDDSPSASWPGLVLGKKVLHIIALGHESADELKRDLLVCWDPLDSGSFSWENNGKTIKRRNGQLPEAI